MIKQTKAEAIVTALHHIPNGEVWSINEIEKRKTLLQSHEFSWSVAESLPVHEEIKYRGPNRQKIIDNYKLSLRHLGKCGINKVCYNFMPVIDWIRTDLEYPWKNGSISMLFDYPTFAAFDIFILKRPNAESSYPESTVTKAAALFEKMNEKERELLAHNIIVVTQGFIDGGVGNARDYKKAFLGKLELYQGIDEQNLRENLSYFINEITPAAEEYGIIMCLHPDDPPFGVLGLPRIAGTAEDYRKIMEKNPSASNGITFCSGSLSSRSDNDLTQFIQTHGKSIHFAHLRNTEILEDGESFCESGHFDGRVNMSEIISALHREMRKRQSEGNENWQIPMRPDHGLKTDADSTVSANPGYPYYGRKIGLDQLTEAEENLYTH